MCIPITPNHIRLIDSCYPHSSALLATAPDYRPNSQELSRLTYYASNRPGKLTKVATYLEKRAKSEAAKARAGNPKAKASLLITLAILRALVTECRRELALFSRTVIISVNVALVSLPSDIEVAARAASVFTAWTTYTDGGLIGVDDPLTKAYLSSLSHFGRLSVVVNEKDGELRNRTRLLGLAALSGVVSSDALYASLPEFKTQAPAIVPALVMNLEPLSVSTLNEVSTAIEASPQPTSPYLAEIQQRPPLSERRAASIHVHIDGEKGPSSLDVVEAALRALKTVFQQSAAAQIASVLQGIADCLDSNRAWNNVEFCCWLADRAIAWSQYQYRFVVPTKIVEQLLTAQDSPVPTARLTSLMAMLTTAFTSPISLVNFSTSDSLTNLVTLMLRRITIDPQDGLLPAIVQCISALGTHVYYADQIQDLAEELVARLVTVQLNGFAGRGASSTDKHRQAAMRCLVLCLKGLIETANSKDVHVNKTLSTSPTIVIEKAKEGDELDTTDPVMERRESSNMIRDDYATNPRRNNLSPEVWQETVAVLCESDYSVRAAYARALVTFLRCEVAREPYAVDHTVADREEGKVRLPVSGRSLVVGDSTTRLLQALHAAAYHLAVSPSLGFSSGPPSEASDEHLESPGPIHVSPPTPLASPGRSPMDDMEMSDRFRKPAGNAPTPKRSLSRALTTVLNRPNPRSSEAATASDYAHLLTIFRTMHRRVPGRALLTGVPMLLALDAAIGDVLAEPDATKQARACAIRELLCHIWCEIGEIWSCKEITDHAGQVLRSLPEPRLLVEPSTPPMETLHAPEQPASFPFPLVAGPTAQSAPPPLFVNAELVVTTLAANERVQAVVGLDRQGVLRRLAVEWTAESALKDSIETQNTDVLRVDGAAALRKISPALMHIDNISLQSVARSGKGVGVGDLREALEGRAGASSTNLGASGSVTSFDRMSSANSGGLAPMTSRVSGKSRADRAMLKSSPAEVRDVLNKLGVGKQTQTNGKLRSPFPVVERQEGEQKTAVLVPPYRS